MIIKAYTYLQLKAGGFIKDTRREKELSNKTPALTKSRNMGIWLVGTSNFSKRSYTDTKFPKK